MIKNVYFHIDELGRDAIVASALKKELNDRKINLVYGNRVYTHHILEKFIYAFDIIILPRPLFLKRFKKIEKEMPHVVILMTECVGRVVKWDNDKLTLFSILDKDFMEGDKKYINKVSRFCLWGESAIKRIKKYYPEISKKFFVTGHPRHDNNCIKKNISKKTPTSRVGLITRQPLLNDFLNRKPIESVVNRYSNKNSDYDYFNKETGDFLLSQDNEIIDELYLEAVDVKLLITLIFKLNDQGHQIFLKVHPRENRNLWVNFIKKYNLNVNLEHWKTPFLHWVANLDFVVGPSSTSFYDCYVAGVKPICTRHIYKKRDNHIIESSEENNELMKYVYSPDSLEKLLEVINKKDTQFELSKEIKDVLYQETNFPDSKKSISNIADVIANLSKKKLVNSFVRDALMICFHLYGRYFINLRLTITRYINKKSEQGSSFLMNKKNIKYIDSLMN